MKDEQTKPKATVVKKLKGGMYNCTIINPSPKSSYNKGDKVIYHSSMAENLEAKGILKVNDIIKKYKPKEAKK